MTMILKTQFGFHQETKGLPYRKRSMHMLPDQFPNLDYKNLLSDISDSENEVSFFSISYKKFNKLFESLVGHKFLK